MDNLSSYSHQILSHWCSCFGEICITESCPWPCEQVNQLKGPAGLPSPSQQCSSRWQTAHTWCKTASFFGLGFFFFPHPLHADRSSRKPAILLATATIPLPLLLWEFANIWASTQEAACAPEFTSACWPMWENYMWRWKHLWKAGFLPHFFWGLLQSNLLVLFPLLPSTFFTFCKDFTLQSGLLGNGDPTNKFWKLSWAIYGLHFVVYVRRNLLWCYSFMCLLLYKTKCEKHWHK